MPATSRLSLYLLVLALILLPTTPVWATADASSSLEDQSNDAVNQSSGVRELPTYAGGVKARIRGQANSFAPASINFLSQAYLKLTGADISDDKMIDDFAALNYCDVMLRYYTDEFAWRTTRDSIRSEITKNLEKFPEYFVLRGTLQLGRYDFTEEAFMLATRSALERVGVFRITTRSINCGNYDLRIIPMNYTFRLNNPITLDRIEIPENKAYALIRKMEVDGNSSRTVYVNFFLKVHDFSSNFGGVRNRQDFGYSLIRATLMSMRVYYDEERKFLLYEYTGDPSIQ